MAAPTKKLDTMMSKTTCSTPLAMDMFECSQRLTFWLNCSMSIVHVPYPYPERMIVADQFMQRNTSEGKNMTRLSKGIQKIIGN